MTSRPSVYFRCFQRLSLSIQNRNLSSKSWTKQPPSILASGLNHVTSRFCFGLHVISCKCDSWLFVCSYTTVDHGSLGHYVTSINGVYEDVAREIAWVLLKLTPDGFCRTTVGQSKCCAVISVLRCSKDCCYISGPYHLIPEDGEHIVYQLETWDIHNEIALCPE